MDKPEPSLESLGGEETRDRLMQRILELQFELTLEKRKANVSNRQTEMLEESLRLEKITSTELKHRIQTERAQINAQLETFCSSISILHHLKDSEDADIVSRIKRITTAVPVSRVSYSSFPFATILKIECFQFLFADQLKNVIAGTNTQLKRALDSGQAMKSQLLADLSTARGEIAILEYRLAETEKKLKFLMTPPNKLSS